MPAAPGGAGSRVLLVDDEQEMCETLALYLVRREFQVSWRISALDALTLVEEQEFDVVITDLNMEPMNGLALCKRLVALRPALPVIVASGFGSAENRAAAFAAGAFDFVPKPFDLERLDLTIDRAVASRVK